MKSGTRTVIRGILLKPGHEPLLRSPRLTHASRPSTAGSHSVSATYNGDTNFNGITLAAITEMVQDFQFSAVSGAVFEAIDAGGERQHACFFPLFFPQFPHDYRTCHGVQW